MKVTVSKRLQRLGTINAGKTFYIVESSIPHYYMRITNDPKNTNFCAMVDLATGVVSSMSRDTLVVPINLKVEEDYED